MVKNLVDKIILDARGKAQDSLKKAEARLEETFLQKKGIIAKEYEEKLDAARKKIDSDMERKLSNFRMEREKEILELQNRLIEEVRKKIEEKFNLNLRDNMNEIIKGLAGEIKGKEYSIKVPETAEVEIENVRVEKDAGLKDAFLLEGAKWKLLFNWERFSSAVSGYIREKAGEYLFGDNGQKGKDRRG
ncbi:MAG TPA: hypothetical protein PKN36_08780 [bacterium]|jgi:vacuolar-type H+-ATPase subunit E/Vma4|nr:hypothetical protein [bacterium]